jgi:hypothetical protein
LFTQTSKVTLSACTFMIDSEGAIDRLSISTTLLLAIVAQKFAYGEKVPSSAVSTDFDEFHNLSFIFIVTMVVQNAVVASPLMPQAFDRLFFSIWITTWVCYNLARVAAIFLIRKHWKMEFCRLNLDKEVNGVRMPLISALEQTNVSKDESQKFNKPPAWVRGLA